MRIMIDPGHGMDNRRRGIYDPGAVANHGGTRHEEATLNLEVATKLHDALRAAGHTVKMSRTRTRETCGLRRRLEIASAMSAELVVSIHHNADPIPGDDEPDGRVKGFQVLHGPNQASEKLARAVTAAVGEGRRVRVVTARSNLYVLRYRFSILIEMGFIDDPEDFVLLTDPAWVDQVVSVVADVITSYETESNDAS